MNIIIWSQGLSGNDWTNEQKSGQEGNDKKYLLSSDVIFMCTDDDNEDKNRQILYPTAQRNDDISNRNFITVNRPIKVHVLK